MSTAAIDISRTSERLSAFLSEIGSEDPIDNYFPQTAALNLLMKNKQMIDGGRQIIYPIDSGANSTIQDFTDFDVFDTTAQDTALTIVYPFVNKGGSVLVSWEEIRETAGSDHRIFDLVKHRRSNFLKSMMDSISTDLFAAAQLATKVTSLNVGIDSTGATGSLNASTDADWAATETASGSFAALGLSDMRTLFNTITENGKEPDTLLTNRTIYEYYESEIDPDVRYSVAQTSGAGKKMVAGRGFSGLEFHGIPLVYDKKATSGVLYMWNSENLFMMIDNDGNFKIDDFQRPTNQKALVALGAFRGNIVINRRKSCGKLTGITA